MRFVGAVNTPRLERCSPLRCSCPFLPQGQKFEYLLNTGNMISKSGLDLSQATGFTVVAEKLNFYRCARAAGGWSCRRAGAAAGVLVDDELRL